MVRRYYALRLAVVMIILSGCYMASKWQSPGLHAHCKFKLTDSVVSNGVVLSYTWSCIKDRDCYNRRTYYFKDRWHKEK